MSAFDEAEEEEFSSAAKTTVDDEPTDTTESPQLKNPTPVLWSMAQEFLQKLRNNKNIQTDQKKIAMNTQWVAAVAALALAFAPLQEADAAMSGGRMGGSFSSSSPRTTISRPSSSYSRGGYSSRAYRSARPSVTIAPTVVTPSYGYGYGSPFVSPFASPFGNPFYGPRVYGSPGVLSVSRGPSVFDLVFWGGLLYVAAQIFSPSTDTETSSFWENDSSVSSPLGRGTSVVQLSVALDVPNRDDPRSILGALDKLSKTAQTDKRVGIQNLSSQVALELLRRRSSIVSASGSSQHYGSREKALRNFQQKSVQERSKFENETVNKFGGVDYGSASKMLKGDNDANDKATMAVVTIILAIDGDSTKINKIRDVTDVEQALEQIASNAKVGDCLQSAEILWTPTDRSETLRLRDVVADYPELRSV